MPVARATPLGDDDFTRLIDGLGPFEPSPRLAVGVSGGADSLALTVLADAWARSRGGAVLAVTVDHCLRPESALEAAALGRQLSGLRIEHAVLRWQDAANGPDLQARARAARLALLAEHCRARGILHLLLAHTADDQAETVLMRFAKGSGPDGLSGIPAVAERPHLRILRPLLPIAKAQLVATCVARRLAWTSDPSNTDPRYARGRLRAARTALAAEGLTVDRLLDTAGRCGSTRGLLEQAVAEVLSDCVTLYPEGYAEIDRDRLDAVPAQLRLAAVSAVIRTVGGQPYRPRHARMARLAQALSRDATRGRTLGGCRILFGRTLTICRESAAASDVRTAVPGRTVAWDGRFHVAVPPLAENIGLQVRRLGRAAASITRGAPRPAVPWPVRTALPGLWRGATLIAAPASAIGPMPDRSARMAALTCAFVPHHPLTSAGFPVASAADGII